MELHPATISNNLQLTMNSCRIWPLFPTFCKSNLSFFGGNDPSSTTTVYQSGPGIVQMQSAPYDLKFARDDIQSILASCFGSFRIISDQDLDPVPFRCWRPSIFQERYPFDSFASGSYLARQHEDQRASAAGEPCKSSLSFPTWFQSDTSPSDYFDHGIPCGEVGNDTWWISPLSWAIKILGVWSSKYARVYSIQSQDEPR